MSPETANCKRQEMTHSPCPKRPARCLKGPKRPTAWSKTAHLIFSLWFMFDLICGPCPLAILDVAVGRLGHIQNLWAVLVKAVLVHGPYTRGGALLGIPASQAVGSSYFPPYPRWRWVPTADQINSTVPIAQIPRSSSTELDHCLVGLVRDLFPTESAGVWSSSDRVAVELIGYWSVQTCYPDHTRTLQIISRSTRPQLDQYPITSSFSSACLLDRYSTFLTVKNNHVGSTVDADHRDHLVAILVPNCLIELIWSAVGAHLYLPFGEPHRPFASTKLYCTGIHDLLRVVSVHDSRRLCRTPESSSALTVTPSSRKTATDVCGFASK